MVRAISTNVMALCSLFLFLVCMSALGRRLILTIGGRADLSLSALASPVVGIAMSACTSLGLLAIGGVAPAFHLIVPVAGFILAWRDGDALVSDWKSVYQEIAELMPMLSLVFVVVLVIMLPFILGPVVDWDSLTFHYRIPFQLLEARHLFIPLDNLHIAQLGIYHLASLPLLILGISSAPAVLSFAMVCLAIITAAVSGNRLGGKIAGNFALAGVVGTPLLLLVGMTPRVDAPLTATILLVFLAIISDDLDGSSARVGVAIVLLGVAGGIKFHGLAFAAILGPWLLWTGRRLLVRHMTMALGIAAVFSVSWLLVNIANFGTPFFPFFSPLLAEPWLASILGSRVIPSGLDLGFRDTMVAARNPFNLLDFMFSPARISIELEGAWYRPSWLLLLFPVVLLARPRRTILLLIVPSLIYCGVVLSVGSSTNVRYLLPAIGPLLLAVASGAAELVKAISTKTLRRLVEVGVFILALWPVVPFALSWNSDTSWGYLIGKAGPTQFRQDHPDETVRVFAGIPNWVHGEVGTSGRLLLLFEPRGGAFDVPTIADTRAFNWPILAQTESPRDCLQEAGISHVLLNLGAANYYVRRGASAESLFLPEFQEFAKNCLSVIHEENGFVFFRIQPRESPATSPTETGTLNASGNPDSLSQ